MGALATAFHANIACGIFSELDGYYQNTTNTVAAGWDHNGTQTCSAADDAELSACTVHATIFNFTLSALTFWQLCLTCTIYRCGCC
jgi:hypothetical protein